MAGHILQPPLGSDPNPEQEMLFSDWSKIPSLYDSLPYKDQANSETDNCCSFAG